MALKRSSHQGRLLAATVAAAITLSGAAAGATTTPTNILDSLRDSAGSDAAACLLERADEALNAITYTYYSSIDHWNPLLGIYKVVCAGYVNHLLDEALPDHFDNIKEARDKGGLGVWDYYGFFGTIDYGETALGWQRIKKVADLRPGDLVVWQYSAASTSTAWGHIVVIASVPKRDTRWSGAYRVRVTDASSSGHSNDNRGTTGSGVGAGEMLIRASSEGKPYSFAWKITGIWRSDITGIRMARPM